MSTFKQEGSFSPQTKTDKAAAPAKEMAQGLITPDTFQQHQLLLVSSSAKKRKAIYADMNWLLQLLYFRYLYFDSKQDYKDFEGQLDFKAQPFQVPRLSEESPYGQWVKKYKLTPEDRLLMATALAKTFDDSLFFSLLALMKLPLVSTVVGGHTQLEGKHFLPSLQTVLFLLGGMDGDRRIHYFEQFVSKRNQFQDWGIDLYSPQEALLGEKASKDEWKNLLISLRPAIWQYFLGGAMPQPEENQQLPLTLLQSELQMDELVLADRVREQLQPVLTFAKKGQDFFKNNQLSKGFRKGFVVLLYGEPGTGKTLIASTLGKHVGLKTYQLEVAQVISKYIGETSQNMEKVFDELERAIDWLEGQPSILFIDEADAIMGKRSEVKDSKDRYANLDTSFLLQRLEKFPGLVILATNFPQNLDEAFKRRIQTQILVPKPEKEQLLQLLKIYLPASVTYPELSFTVDFAALLGEKFNLT
ncbi:MAG: ATP-binding protein, partial [Thermonemataceae bacterium]